MCQWFITTRDIIISTSDILLQNFDFYYIDKQRSKAKCIIMSHSSAEVSEI